MHTQDSFFGLGIAPKLLEVLERMKFTVPTPIQAKAIPNAIEGKDFIGIAQTGTGKTLAFGIPMIQRLQNEKGRGLVLVPTRELALQVQETFQKIEKPFGIKSVVIIGGASMENQIRDLKRNPRIVIATPGRLIDHMNQRHINLHDVSILVLDEADRMLDMGFAPQIETILKTVAKERQTMLLSATMPNEIVKIATSYMKLPLHIEVAPQGTAAERVTQELFIVKKEAKKDLLAKILGQYHGTVLLFSRTKIGAMKITRGLKALGHRAAEIHSDRSLSQRREALDGFKSGRYRILVATDIAARGIDVKNIELVINFDLPEDPENYIHRIGRTGRAGVDGHAISLATPDQGEEIRNIERLMRSQLPVSEHPEFPKENFVAISSRSPSRFGSFKAKSGSNRKIFGSRTFTRPGSSPHKETASKSSTAGFSQSSPSKPSFKRDSKKGFRRPH